MPSLEQGVVYQVYPRSFQDDGVGWRCGRGSTIWLGVDALWLSPIYPSPLADFGYDVCDYTGVDPVFGTLGDFDALVEDARARGLSVLMDIVPCHTSIRHPWFREHPEWYIWADRPNNWRSAFGGSAWTRSGERYYLHSFYPEQPDLDWRNPAVVRAMQEILRFWLERARCRLPRGRDRPPVEGPAVARRPARQRAVRPAAECRSEACSFPQRTGHQRRWRRSARPSATASWSERCTCRAPAGVLSRDLDAAYVEPSHAPWDAEPARGDRRTTRQPGAAWALSNHDFGRLVTRFRTRERARRRFSC